MNLYSQTKDTDGSYIMLTRSKGGSLTITTFDGQDSACYVIVDEGSFELSALDSLIKGLSDFRDQFSKEKK